MTSPGPAAKRNPRGAGDLDRKALRDRLRHKGDARRGDGEPQPDMVGQSGGGP
jgi:hypothetical protein